MRYRQGLATVSVDSGGSPSYVQYDGLGSVVNLTSSTGGHPVDLCLPALGVTRQTRDILRGGNAFGVFQGAPGSSMK